MQENKSVKISLAGDLGSGKSTVGAILAERLSAAVYSTGTIQRKIAEEMGMTTLQLNQYMETHPEIDGKIFFTSSRRPYMGEYLQVRLTDMMDIDLLGENAEDSEAEGLAGETEA